MIGVQTNIRQSSGFTLIEVLLAIAIFSVISLASFNIFDGVMQSEKVSQDKMQRMNEIQRAWLVIERDFLQIAQRTIRLEGEAPLANFIHANSYSFSASDQVIAFVRAGWTNPGLLIPRSDLQSVAYRLEDENLERLHFNFVDAVVGEEPKVRLLINDVIAFDIEYFYQGKWQKELVENSMPQAIQLAVETRDLGLFTRKFIVAANAILIKNQNESNDPNNQNNSPNANAPSQEGNG